MTVRYEQTGDVAVITLDRPDVFNSIDQSITDGMVATMRRAADQARVVVITGAGKAFCAGADLGDLKAEYDAGDPDLHNVITSRFNPIVEAVIDAPVPTIAAVNGAAAGAGMGLALACDLRVMAESSFLMSAFVNVALIPDTGSSWSLPHHVGVSRAMEIAFTGRRVMAEEALSLGLAHKVVPSEALLETATGWATDLANGPIEAMVETRHLLHRASASDLRSILAEEADIQGRLGRGPGHLEGMNAFLEKRKPDFRST